MSPPATREGFRQVFFSLFLCADLFTDFSRDSAEFKIGSRHFWPRDAVERLVLFAAPFFACSSQSSLYPRRQYMSTLFQNSPNSGGRSFSFPPESCPDEGVALIFVRFFLFLERLDPLQTLLDSDGDGRQTPVEEEGHQAAHLQRPHLRGPTPARVPTCCVLFFFPLRPLIRSPTWLWIRCGAFSVIYRRFL